MSALPTPRPQGRQNDSRKQALRKIVRLLEEQMEELGLTEVEKNAGTAAFVEMPKNSNPPVRKLLPSCRSLKDHLRARGLNAVSHGRTPDLGDEITRPPSFDLSGVPRNPRSVR
jgi:hypothetical protein